MVVAKRLSTIAYYNVDIILVVFLVVLVLLTGVYLVTRFVFRRICGLVSKKKTEWALLFVIRDYIIHIWVGPNKTFCRWIDSIESSTSDITSTACFVGRINSSNYSETENSTTRGLLAIYLISTCFEGCRRIHDRFLLQQFLLFNGKIREARRRLFKNIKYGLWANWEITKIHIQSPCW